MELAIDEADRCPHCAAILRDPPNCCPAMEAEWRRKWNRELLESLTEPSPDDHDRQMEEYQSKCCICNRPSVGFYQEREDCPSCGMPGCELRMQVGLDYHDEIGNR